MPAKHSEGLEKPAPANRNDVIIAGKLQTDACRELLRKNVVACQFEVGIAIADVDVID